MASPQKENGYVAVATELVEAFARTRINGEARQVLDVIIRKTYGFNKKEDAISLSQFCLATGLHKSAVCKAILKLKSMNLITQKVTTFTSIYALNKHYLTWQPVAKKRRGVTKKEIGSHQKGNNRYPKGDIQKTVSKDTITKDISTKVDTGKPESFGNENINQVIQALKDGLGGTPDGTVKENRQFAKLLLSKMSKDYPNSPPTLSVERLITVALRDGFHAKNATSFKYLYYNAQKIIQSLKGSIINTKVVKI